VKWAVVLLALAACARSVPPQRPTAAGYRDLERMVSFQQQKGWGVDRLEVQGLLAGALDTVCRLEPVRRTELLAWLDAEIARRGGPVEQAWRARGKSIKRVSSLLQLTRVRMIAQAAVVAADADCPFWVEPEPGFRGRQISDDRWQLTGGGGGNTVAVIQGKSTDLHFGGAGRLLIGRNFGSRSAFYVGQESGASASFPRDEMGNRGNLVLGLDMVQMLVYRYTRVGTYWETEAGWLVHLDEDEIRAGELDPDHGFHLGAAFGARATRTRFFFPGAAFGISYERTLVDGADIHAVKIGLRVAFDVDL
jgi:hypothetical protein